MPYQAQTGNSKISQFHSLKRWQQHAVIRKADGASNDMIARELKRIFKVDKKPDTVRWWFSSRGTLEQAYLEHVTTLANESVRQGRLKIQRLTNTAAERLEELMKSKDEKVAGAMVKVALAKFIPDRQAILTGEEADTIPAELMNDGDDAFDQHDDITANDDARTGQNDTETPGASQDEEIPTGILSESGETSSASDSPA